ncbi:MAG: IPT/TIG domain-containing protein [Candidatus Binatia bacterium]
MTSPSADRASTAPSVLLAAAWGVLWGLFVGASCAPPPPPIQYLYDESSRLIAVIDPSATGNNTGVYVYDEVGNITQIKSYPSSQVSLISVTPKCGASGTVVTIRGTGFVSPPTSNMVTFGVFPGVAGGVTGGDDTTLTVTVPTPASGPVVVSNASGSAQWPGPFSQPCGAPPVVVGFTPDIGVVGTPVTVSGTGFQPALFGESVAFNGTASVLFSGTPTSIVTAVPSQATTGPVSVTTAYGTGTSAASYEVVTPPGYYTPADVETVIRMSIGETKTFTVTDPNKVALVRFDGTASTLLTIQANPTPQTCLYDPNGQSLLNCFNPNLVLALTGRYTLVVDPSASGPSTVTLTLTAKPVQSGGRLYLHTFDLPGLGKRMNTKLGTGVSASWACADSSNWNFHSSGGPTITWYSPPVALPVTVFYGCCPATFAMWGLESSGQTNAAFATTLGFTSAPTFYWFDGADDVEMTIGTSGCASATAGSGTGLHTWSDQLSFGPVTLNPGDRFWLTVRAGQAPGTSGPSGGSGKNAQLHYNRNTAGVDGASYVDLPQTVIFDCTNPADCGP